MFQTGNADRVQSMPSETSTAWGRGELYETLCLLVIGVGIWFVGVTLGTFDFVKDFVTTYNLDDLLMLAACMGLALFGASDPQVDHAAPGDAERDAAAAQAEAIARHDASDRPRQPAPVSWTPRAEAPKARRPEDSIGRAARSISTVSSRSTTATATPPATPCCARSPTASRAHPAGRDRRPGSAATNSPCCSRSTATRRLMQRLRRQSSPHLRSRSSGTQNS